jgi:hypothetical protein
MPDKLFQVPLSHAERAQDRFAFQTWLDDLFDVVADDDDALVLTHQEVGIRLAEIARNAEELERRREAWAARSKEREELAASELQLRILRQRSKREGSPLLRIAMLAEAERVRRLVRGMYHHGPACVRCGLTLRYNSTNKCIACVKARAAIWNKAHHRYNASLRQQRENRLVARIAGSARYQGRPCRKCGATTYYTKNCHCVACDNARQARRSRRFNPILQQHRDNRAAAKAAGLKTFEGTACKRCGSTARYVSNKNCAKCDSKKKQVSHGTSG